MTLRFASCLICCAMALCACRLKAQTPAETPATSVKPQSATPDSGIALADAAVVSTPDSGIADTRHDAVAAAKPECVDDRQCEEYLRCEAGACVVPPAVEGREVEGMPTASFVQDDKTVATFKLEVADEPWERTRGLMYRRKMHPDFGMIFIFDSDAVRSFWMKNTLIPLDMVHIDAKGLVVGVVAKAEPMTLSPRRTGSPARYVLELTSGRAAAVGIVKGMKMDLTGLPAELSPP